MSRKGFSALQLIIWVLALIGGWIGLLSFLE